MGNLWNVLCKMGMKIVLTCASKEDFQAEDAVTDIANNEYVSPSTADLISSIRNDDRTSPVAPANDSQAEHVVTDIANNEDLSPSNGDLISSIRNDDQTFSVAPASIQDVQEKKGGKMVAPKNCRVKSVDAIIYAALEKRMNELEKKFYGGKVSEEQYQPALEQIIYLELERDAIMYSELESEMQAQIVVHSGLEVEGDYSLLSDLCKTGVKAGKDLVVTRQELMSKRKQFLESSSKKTALTRPMRTKKSFLWRECTKVKGQPSALLKKLNLPQSHSWNVSEVTTVNSCTDTTVVVRGSMWQGQLSAPHLQVRSSKRPGTLPELSRNRSIQTKKPLWKY